VQAIILREQEQARRNQMIQEAGEWLQTVLEGKIVSAPPDAQKYIDILRSCFLFEKESPHWELGRAVMSRAGITDNETVFDFLTRVGVWSETENTDLYRFKIPVEFSEPVLEAAQNLLRRSKPPADDRRDLTGMDLMTIDGQATLDFDDALSIEKTGDNYLLGVHIADVGHFIQKNDPIDQEARTRGSSIYMPDCRIPMVPSVLAEDQMSLKAGKVRPAISLMVRLTPQAEVLDYEIFPSLIRIRRQLTYYEVNLTSDIDPKIIALHRLAESFRKSRIQKDAVHISLPEINIWIDEDGELVLSRVNRESPGRMLVSEMMILANWLMARFLSDRQMPAIFRSQPAPRDRLFKGISDDLFQNWMQRKLLNRFLLSRNAEPHSGLGLDAYTTATSPIRKYSDLITQRQIRAALGLESPYTDEEVDRIIQMLEEPVNAVGRIQYSRHRFWLLKRLESRKGEKEPALVLARRRNGYSVLLTDYMIECDLAVPANISLRPEDLIRVVVQHVDARKDKISVYLN
jgi:exoribonuclease-2